MTSDTARSRIVQRGHYLESLHREIVQSGHGLRSALKPDATRHPARLEVRRDGSGLMLDLRVKPASGGGWEFVDGFGGRIGPADDPKMAVWEIRGRFDASKQ